MNRNPVETILGAVVVLVATIFLAFAYSLSNIKPMTGYPLKATFSKIGGLQNGSDVRISGIKVGTVTGEVLDSRTYQAEIHLSITPEVHLPVDTVASIASDGMLGGKYLRLDPGSAKDKLPAGGTISETRDYKSLEEMVSEIIFMATQDPGGPK
ncbi:MAG: outer membrane lipid asymmetry maintenance protein MlaD [Alphaproteobacteria bacterium]|nr:outer membrane lipid asymmetry maintenance protein MlaD [Alphaproteobacteria bacterium]